MNAAENCVRGVDRHVMMWGDDWEVRGVTIGEKGRKEITEEP